MDPKKRKQVLISVGLGVAVLGAILLAQLLAPDGPNFIYQNF
jgi:hypothetical protein